MVVWRRCHDQPEQFSKLCTRNLVMPVILLAILAVNYAVASPPDGHWKIVWSCKGATGAFENPCRDGANDYFELRLWTHGDEICGFHDATSHLQQRSDDGENIDGKPSVTGTFHGNLARVTFRSTRVENKEFGATLRALGKKLIWKRIHPRNDGPLLPDNATLLKRDDVGNEMDEDIYARQAAVCAESLSR